MTQSTKQFGFQVGKLKKTKFKTAQEFADELARNLSATQETPEPSSQVQSGSSVSVSSESMTVPNAATSFETNRALKSAIVNLEITTGTPTVGILAIQGSKVYFTGAIPNANYVLHVTSYTVTTS